jgi:molybdate transport system substrate-binding protein
MSRNRLAYGDGRSVHSREECLPTEITAHVTNGIKEATIELLPEFERAHGVTVNVSFNSTKLIVEAAEAGVRADLLVLTAEAIDDLIGCGKVLTGSRIDIARSGIGVAVPAGAPRPDISTPEALKRALLAARRVSYSRVGASGIYTANVLIPRLGIAEEMKSRALLSEPGTPVGVLLANRKAEIGLQQISELVPVPGVDIVGPLPGDLQKMTTFSAGIPADAASAETARALAAYLASPDALPAMRRQGLEPA